MRTRMSGGVGRVIRKDDPYPISASSLRGGRLQLIETLPILQRLWIIARDHAIGRIVQRKLNGERAMKTRAPRNRTITCTNEELTSYRQQLLTLEHKTSLADIESKIICQDFHEAAALLPTAFVDLLIVDPPYNLSKDYNGSKFKERSAADYIAWFRDVIAKLKPMLKQNSSIYFCSDWKTSILIAPILEESFCLRNRITWERDKGRGAKANWKNNTEDIWFCTNSNEYVFNLDDVKMKRKVVAPYRQDDGKPKDWDEEDDGNYRLTCPSNIWTDLTVPFWSMPENTDHPTQKPEKLISKLILASTNEGDFVFDPFQGSGTTSVVAKKLKRRFCSIEQNEEYCCWAAKRLAIADDTPEIQGYVGGVFWERNSLSEQKPSKQSSKSVESMSLFDV